MEHSNRALCQASVWAASFHCLQNLPSPEGYGWTMKTNIWTPFWTTLPEIAKASQELLKCGCKTIPLCSRRCKCKDAGLSCTTLCYCKDAGLSCTTLCYCKDAGPLLTLCAIVKDAGLSCTTRCYCKDAGLSCTALCYCGGSDDASVRMLDSPVPLGAIVVDQTMQV